MKKLVIICGIALMVLVVGCQQQPQPTITPTPTPTPKTTEVILKEGDKGTIVSGSFPAFTLDELITHSDTIVLGKVANILPARKDKDPLGRREWIIYQDVIVQTERYLYGKPESEFVAIRVLGGKVGDTYLMSDADPVFTLGEEVLLFLYVPPERFIQNVPEGIDPHSIYKVTASIPGKYEFKDDIATSYKGETTDISTVEEKIAAASRNQ